MPLDGSFTKFLEETKLVHENEVEVLQGTRIAIDAAHWLKELAQHINEPYQAVMGGVPLTLARLTKQRLEQFKRLSITPIFVFPGLPAPVVTSPQQHVQNHDQMEIYKLRETAWEHHHTAPPADAAADFTKAGGNTTSTEFHNHLIRILRDCKVEFIRAPYLQWAQMAYFAHPTERLVHHVYGPLDLVMYDGIATFITDMAMDKDVPTFKYVTKDEIRAVLMRELDADYRSKPLDDSQFLDCCLLAQLGTRRFPENFPKIAQMVAKFKTGATVLQNLPQNQAADAQDVHDHAVTTHLRLRAIVRHGMVLTWDGQCQALSLVCRDPSGPEPKVPVDLSTIWGLRLPNIVYYFMSVGAVHTEALTSVVQSQMLELLPAGVDTLEYRDLLNKIFPLRLRTSATLHGRLAQRDQQYKDRKTMSCHVWHCPSQNHPILGPSSEDMQFSHNEIVDKLRDDKRTKIDFYFVLKHFKSRAGPDTPPYNTVEEITCAIQLQALNYLGYLNHAKDQSDMNFFSEALLATQADEFSEYAVLLIELFRTEALTCSHFSYVNYTPGVMEPSSRGCDPFVVSQHHAPLRLPAVYLDQPAGEKLAYDRCCLLVSRIFSLLPMALSDSEPWTAGVSKDLLAFNTLVRKLLRTLRDLVEVIGACMYVEGRADIDPQHFHEIPRFLPFAADSGTTMGLVIDHILRSDDHFGEEELKAESATREQRVAHLKKTFPCCVDLEGDLKKAFRFWKATLVLWKRLVDECFGQRVLKPTWQQIDGHILYADIFLRIKLHQIIDLGDDQFKEA